MDTTCDTIAEPPAAVAAPAGRDVACPLCEYNLRGLAERRCPECGYAFTWDELLDPAKQKHPYLFEHHPRRNVVSFVRTLLGGLRPRRFWRTLNPAMPSRPRRLAVYGVLVTCLLVFAPVVGFVRHAIDAASDASRFRAMVWAQIQRSGNDPQLKQLIARHGSAEQVLDAYAPPALSRQSLSVAVRDFDVERSHVHTVFAIVAWTWLTFFALMIFRWSMRRAKVRAGHVARCVVWVRLGLVARAGRVAAVERGSGLRPAVPGSAALATDPRVGRLRGVRHVPPRRGVRELPPLRAPYETAMATQLIVLLVVMAFALN